MPGERTRYAEPALLCELRKKGPEMDGTIGAWRRSDSSWLPDPRAFRPGLQVRPSLEPLVIGAKEGLYHGRTDAGRRRQAPPRIGFYPECVRNERQL